jgi:hypothetical protein
VKSLFAQGCQGAGATPAADFMRDIFFLFGYDFA